MKYLEQFLEMMLAERGMAKNSIIAYQKDLLDFNTYIIEEKIFDPIEVNTNHIRAFTTVLASQNVSSRSVARKISAIKGFYNFLISENLLTENPTHLIDLPKYSSPLPIVLSLDNIRELIESIKQDKSPEGIRLRAMIHLLYASGMRVSELVSLKITNLSIDSNTHKIKNHIYIQGKGNKERIVIINDTALSMLEIYMPYRDIFIANSKNGKYVFPSKASQGYMTRQNFAILLKKSAIEANIDPDTISPHILRHSFASHLLAGGADLRVIQELLGHADITTTQIYTHVETSRLKNVIDQHHPIAKKKI